MSKRKTENPSKQAVSWRDTLPVHPAAERFDPLSPDELRALGEDIKRNGLINPVVTFCHREKDGPREYSLLDGRNRLDAMEAVGLAVTIKTEGTICDVTVLDADGNVVVANYTDHEIADPYAYVISANIHRRHLTAERKRELIIEIIARAPKKSDRQIGKELGFDHKTIGAARAKGEDVGKIPHVATRTDTEGREQPAHKARTEQAAGNAVNPVASADQRKAEAAAAEPKPSLVTGVAMAPHSERGADLYETPACAVRALVDEAEPFSGTIWECACGPGAIVRVLRKEAGYRVVATDLIDYGLQGALGGVDFLKQTAPPKGATIVLTNPPYRLANKFVRHALALAPRVVMLLPLRFLESTGRADILDGGQLEAVFVFRNRLPMMHRAGWNGAKIKSGAIAFAWFIWDRDHHGPATVHRISWRAEPAAAPSIAAPAELPDPLDIPAKFRRPAEAKP